MHTSQLRLRCGFESSHKLESRVIYLDTDTGRPVIDLTAVCVAGTLGNQTVSFVTSFYGQILLAKNIRIKECIQYYLSRNIKIKECTQLMVMYEMIND